MKIIICTYTLSNGGAERVVAQWASGFAQRGEDVRIVLLKDCATASKYPVDPRVKIVNISSTSNNPFLNMLATSYRLRRLVKTCHIEIAISALCPAQVLLATLLTRCLKINTEHDAFERPKEIIWSKERFFKYNVNKLFDIVTVLTSRDLILAKDKLREVYRLPNPLAIEPICSEKKPGKIIMAVGRLDAWHCKGFDILISAWSHINNDFPDWKLLIIGGGTENSRNFLYDLAEKKGCLKSLSIMDFKEDIVDYYRMSSIFVLSSRYEGFGLVLIEAMSQSCACIACDYIGRQAEIFGDEDCGIICTPDDTDSLASAMSELLSNPESRNKYSAAACERSKAYSLNTIMDMWYSILKAKVR